jgi:SAM-dependent methyltransferase
MKKSQPTSTSHEIYQKSLASEDYNDARVRPRVSDFLYLHIKDLKQALDAYKTDDQLSVLDYGCGGSPYRYLFPNSDYKRADYVDLPDLDYKLDETGTVPAPDAFFDLVLSTQVMEHLREPQIYLAECLRLLKPGGRVIITTHGIYQEHGCPYDFQRWTTNGLKRDLAGVGFDVVRCDKFTIGPRALVVLMNSFLGTMRSCRGTIRDLPLRFLRFFYVRSVSIINRIADKAFADCISCDGNGLELLHNKEALYISVVIEGKKPV